MGQEYLIDTNTVIDFLGGLLPENANELNKRISGNLSVVTRIELLAWPAATQADVAMLTGFISDCAIFNLSEDIIIKTIEIRKNHRLKLGDAIIAATAMVNQFKLLSRNVADFKKVPDLVTVDPYLL